MPIPVQTLEHGLFVREYPVEQSLGTLLFLHGLGSWGHCFEDIVRRPELARWRKLAPDMVGYGKTPWEAEPVPLNAMVDRLGTWLRARGEAGVHLIAHSMGGAMAVVLAERYPDLVKSLINVEGNIVLQACTFSRKIAAQSFETFVEGGGYAALCDNIYRSGIEHPTLRDFYASLHMCDPRTYHTHAVELVHTAEHGDLLGRLATLKIPVLYIAGAPGGVALSSVRRMQEKGIDCRVIEPAGHVPFLDQPTAFTRLLAKTLIS